MLSNIFRSRQSQIRSFMSSSTNSASGSVATAITEKLTSAFTPTHLEVRNESHMHNVPTGSETHFKVIVISDKFKVTRTSLARHRLVNEILKEEIAADGPVHALSIIAMTPDQWQEKIDRGETIGASPNCRGGDGSLPKRN